MPTPISRRQAVVLIPSAAFIAATVSGQPTTAPPDSAAQPKPSPGPWPGFPQQDRALVREVVGASHRDEKRVRELVDAHPALVNAWWDWGFGDWESPLGAASHVGQRAIAEFLIERGARTDLFAIAMLGHTDVLKVLVAARPGIHKTLGPHGIPLLAHARAGGPAAADTLKYLETLDGAGAGLPAAAITDQQRQSCAGRYQLPGGEQFEITIDRNNRLAFVLGQTNCLLHHAGDLAFFPSGVPSVRLTFHLEGPTAQRLTISQAEPVATAQRVAQ